MVYGRELDGRVLDFEASGALLQASLVMRDRQTDSWWSIMSSDAIGGPLSGAELAELPVGKKALWGEWRREHPETLVLSVDGVEHVEGNPYDSYLEDDGTFRGIQAEDDRLPAKEPVYAFWLGDQPLAIAHSDFAGGRLVDVPTSERRLLLFRAEGAAIYASTEAWWVEAGAATSEDDVAATLEAARSGGSGFHPVGGFDTFWYTWAGVNRGTGLLRP